MTLQILAYSFAVGAALGLVGHCCERFAAWGDMPRRLVWILALATSIGYPLVAVLTAQPAATPVAVLQELPATPSALASPGMQLQSQRHIAPAVASADQRASPETTGARAGTTWLPWRWPSSEVLGTNLLRASVTISSIIWLSLLGAGVLLHRRARRWPVATVQGQAVLVSDNTGPALIGAWRPRIVVPRWFLDEPASSQALILAHERMHRSAHDPLLLRVALLLVAVFPWNLPLWWQLRRLRRAIEIDCDARVMGTGAAADAYGEVLLRVAQRAGAAPTGIMAMSEPVSTLEYRIRQLTPVPARRVALRAAGAAMLALAGAAVAVTLEVPPLPARVAATLPSPTQQVIPFSASPAVATDERRSGPELLAAQERTSEPASPAGLQHPATQDPPPARDVAEKASAPLVPGEGEAAGRALRVLLQAYPELLHGQNQGGWYSAAVALRADGSLFHSGLRFADDRTQAIRDILDLRYIPEAAVQRAGATPRRPAGAPALEMKQPGELMPGGGALQNHLVFQYAVLPAGFDEKRSLLAVWDAVLSRHAELLLPRDAGVANRVTVFLTEDGGIAREKIEVGPRARMLAGQPDFATLGIAAQDIGERGTLMLVRNDYTEVDAAPTDEQMLRAALWSALGIRDELIVQYAWPRRPGEPAGGTSDVGAAMAAGAPSRDLNDAQRGASGPVSLRAVAAEVLQGAR